MTKPTVMIVEDDRALREALCTTLQLAGFSYVEADSGEAALTILGKKTVDLIVSDVNMPGIDGHELLQQVRESHPGIPMMLITAYGQIKNAVEAMQAGAVDYLVKPFEPKLLTDSVNKVLGLGQNASDTGGPVAEDPFTKQLFQVARKVAASESTVMISGESGTGKEVLARYIHDHSPRSKQPFVAINCAAIPENMLEAMLFGHEKGAFTGAYASSPGKFEQANGGTLLLDEVSEMDMALQAKLLRVLQEREVERVGGRKTIALDVRVLATTNRDLRDYVREGKFREDLYYRLSVFPMAWKPLRERQADIWPLAQRLLSDHAVKMKRPGITLDPATRPLLTSYGWPGNVRELDNAVQRSLIMASGNSVRPEDLCLDISAASDWVAGSVEALPTDVAYETVEETVQVRKDLDLSSEDDASALGLDLKKREYQIIIDTLRQENGKKKQTAERLGISPRTLRYKLAQMRDYGIDVAAELAA